jgi:hypothetical protein
MSLQELPAGERIGASSEFWARFAARGWGGPPQLFRRIQTPVSRMGPERLFALTLASFKRAEGEAPALKFYVDGEPVSKPGAMLPNEADGSFEGYHARMTRSCREYGLVISDLHSLDPECLAWMCEFLDGLYDKVGMPTTMVQADLYIGNYKRTPFGVHSDACSTFYFPVVGRKRMRFWHPEYIKQHGDIVRAMTYEKHLGDSVLLDAGVGDMMYWSPPFWHIGESDGDLSVTWGIGLWVGKTVFDGVTQQLRALLESAGVRGLQHFTTPFAKACGDDGSADSLPAETRSLLGVLDDMSPSELADAMSRRFLARASAYSFAPFLPLRPEPVLAPGDRVVAVARRSLTWAKLSDGSLCIGAGGRTFEQPDTPALRRLLARLASASPWTVSDLLQGIEGPELPRDDAMALVAGMVSLGGVMQCP